METATLSKPMTETRTPVRRALLSVFYKDGVVELAQALHSQGAELLSTGGTMRAIKKAGLPVTEVADYTGFPEMMDGTQKFMVVFWLGVTTKGILLPWRNMASALLI